MNAPSPADIVEALVREYLVRSGCTSALEAFNREKPKHSNSITKREILRKTLSLDKAALLYKKQNPSVEASPSTLEVWVNYQMSKLSNTSEAAAAPQPTRPTRGTAREEDPEDASTPLAASSAPRRPISASGSSAAAVGPPRPAAPRQGFGFGDAPAPSRPVAPVPTRGMAGMNLNSHEDEDDEAEIIRPAAPGHRTSSSSSGVAVGASRTRAVSGAGTTPATSSPVPARSSAGISATAPPRSPALAPRPSAMRTGSATPQGELVMEDVGDEGFDDGVGSSFGPVAGLVPMRPSGPTIRKPGAPIPPDTMRQLRQLLWGAQGQPPPSWKQGFFFSRHAGLQFGLVQRQGGPCGVLAGVQAHVLAALHTPAGGFNTTPRSPEQHSALTAAVAEILWQARLGPAAVLILPEGEAGGAASKLGYDQLSRALTQHSAATKEALVDLVRGALPALMAEDGWGVVLLVLSLALSRGVVAVRGDMDEPDNSLMGMHGYCTQELVNLILLGAATSNVFDGNRQLDGATTLKGVSRRAKLGLLTLFEWYKYVEVGPSLKNPSLPVWVVCSESHFTVLFAQDSRAAASQLPFDLFYYDELANQEAIIRLSVSKDPRGGWTARMGSTMGDRGKCEGQNIPPLECVIETRWPGVNVNWNGSEPIL